MEENTTERSEKCGKIDTDIRWHIVRFASDEECPHAFHPMAKERWNKVRGKPVRITSRIGRETWLEIRGTSDGCDCEEAFKVHPDTVEELGIHPTERWVCRRQLEMD